MLPFLYSSYTYMYVGLYGSGYFNFVAIETTTLITSKQWFCINILDHR